MSRWLQRQVDQEGVDPRDPWLYNSTITSFRRQYADILQEEKARAIIMKGLKMDPSNPDGYIAKFEELVHHANFNINDPLTIGHYTKDITLKASHKASTKPYTNLTVLQHSNNGGKRPSDNRGSGSIWKPDET